MQTTPFLLDASQPPVLDLIFSILVGVAQGVIGGMLVRRGIRRPQAPSFAIFALVLIGIWLLGSGMAEVCVSGLMLFARLSGTTVTRVRSIADVGLFALTGVLLLVLALYPLWRRTRAAAHRGQPEEHGPR